MFKSEDVKTANATSRGKGFIGRGAVVPRAVREHLERCHRKQDTMILDFGAGKTANHARELSADGWMVTAYEFGDNVDVRYHNELALMQEYDVIYASNVLNVQSNTNMAQTTIKQMADVIKEGGRLFANYPPDPRKSDITTGVMSMFLAIEFRMVINLGTNSKPLWCCTK